MYYRIYKRSTISVNTGLMLYKYFCKSMYKYGVSSWFSGRENGGLIENDDMLRMNRNMASVSQLL